MARNVAVLAVLVLAAALVAACGDAPAGPDLVSEDPPPPVTGTVSTVTIPATASGFAARDAHLYLPPGYHPGQAQRLPVLVMLAGVPGNTGDWFTSGEIQPALDEFAAGHAGVAPIVVAPDDTGTGDEDLLCMDSPRAKLDTYLSRDVPRWVTQNLAADPDSRHWAVAGLSYGGTCAYELAVRHPAQFPTFADFSGEERPMHDTVAAAVNDIFAGDNTAYRRQDPLAILAQRTFRGTAGMITVGADDEPYTSEQQTVFQACRRAGMQVQWKTLPGGHEWSLWAEFFRQSLPWLAQRLGLDRVPG
ncbi:alpha/beta hydrolase family protein [Amycolatopsis sp. GM8]|uniref:alpha/beta hydrolase n=1 Tax=Amycolatopsis sp. GM8 TaxID=2896530 RepID=UPI001EEDC6A5|nr:alpha/beta hydrolase-fold protein [Amycolatopsis sp. GM8]